MQARNEYEARGILTNTALNGGGSACCSGIKNRDSEGSNVESRRGMSAFNSDTTSFRARQSGTQNRHGGDAAPGGDGAVAHSLRESWTSCAAFAGAFLVAPPDVTNPDIRPKHLMTFGPYPRDPLPFPSITVASRNDPFGAYEHADEIAASWGSLLIDAGESGHINADSGHGPWPEGTMVFAQFLSRLKG